MPSFLQPPSREGGTFLGAPLCTDLEQLSAPIAVIGAPHGSPYTLRDFAADTINAPTAVRARSHRFAASIGHYDFDLDGVAFGGGPLPFVDCGDVIGHAPGAARPPRTDHGGRPQRPRSRRRAGRAGRRRLDRDPRASSV